jgi:hypothetical protein
MFSIKLKYIILVSVTTTLNFGSFANLEGSKEIVLEIQHPQILTISTITNKDDYDPSVEITKSTTWTIQSNNAVNVNFYGTTPSDLYSSTDILTPDSNLFIRYPLLYKQKVNARNGLVPRRYDYLETTFGVKISDYDSTQRQVTQRNDFWKSQLSGSNIESVYGSPSNLVLDTCNVVTSECPPGGYWGAIMPNDNGTFDLTLYSYGAGSALSQSGNYKMELTLNVSANEQL